MRLLFIRHGDPDYANNTLTETGWKEAKLLADYADKLNLGTCYCSPLGRAKDTASCTLKRLGITAQEKIWLQEFNVGLNVNGSAELQAAYPDTHRYRKDAPPVMYHSLMDDLRPEDQKTFLDENGEHLPFLPRVPWDILPSYYAAHPELANPDGWRDSLIAKAGHVDYYYDYVCSQFDALLLEHGYRREGRYYAVEKGNEETLTFFCHLGTTLVLLSHIWNLSPFVFPQSMAIAPTSVTELVTEEREKGVAHFRGLRIGDISHLAIAGQAPVFSGRFCERFENKNQRH